MSDERWFQRRAGLKWHLARVVGNTRYGLCGQPFGLYPTFKLGPPAHRKCRVCARHE